MIILVPATELSAILWRALFRLRGESVARLEEWLAKHARWISSVQRNTTGCNPGVVAHTWLPHSGGGGRLVRSSRLPSDMEQVLGHLGLCEALSLYKEINTLQILLHQIPASALRDHLTMTIFTGENTHTSGSFSNGFVWL